MNRRYFIKTAALSAASFTTSSFTGADDAELQPIWAQIEKRRDESLRRSQGWIRQPAIAVENRGMNEGCELIMRLLGEAGFTQRRQNPDRWASRRIRAARRGRAAYAGPLFHVRREAGRSRRVVVAAV